MTDFAEILKDARQGAGLVMIPLASYERLIAALDKLDPDTVRIMPQYKLEAPYCFTEEQATRLASVEWRRGMDEAIAFLNRHAQHEHFGTTFASMLSDYADKCAKPIEAVRERKPIAWEVWSRMFQTWVLQYGEPREDEESRPLYAEVDLPLVKA